MSSMLRDRRMTSGLATYPRTSLAEALASEPSCTYHSVQALLVLGFPRVIFFLRERPHVVSLVVSQEAFMQHVHATLI